MAKKQGPNELLDLMRQLAVKQPQMKLTPSMMTRAKAMMGKVGGASLGKVGAVGGAAMLAPFLLEALTGGMGQGTPEVVSAEDRFQQFEMGQNLADMQQNMAQQDPQLYTALLQFLSGQAPVTGLSETSIRFGGPKGQVDNESIQSSLMQLLGSGGLGAGM